MKVKVKVKVQVEVEDQEDVNEGVLTIPDSIHQISDCHTLQIESLEYQTLLSPKFKRLDNTDSKDRIGRRSKFGR